MAATSSSPGKDERLLTEESLAALHHDFLELPDFERDGKTLSRITLLSKPRKVRMPTRRHAVLYLNEDYLPPVKPPPPPSESLLGHTISEAMRLYPDQRHDALFSASVSKLGLPLEANSSHAKGQRMGDGIHASRTLKSLKTLKSSSHSVPNLRSPSKYAGKALMVSGGAPISPKDQRSLEALQVKLLSTQVQVDDAGQIVVKTSESRPKAYDGPLNTKVSPEKITERAKAIADEMIAEEAAAKRRKAEAKEAKAAEAKAKADAEAAEAASAATRVQAAQRGKASRKAGAAAVAPAGLNGWRSV